MGWNSANEIVDPQIELLVKRVDNDEVDPAVAQELLVTLIDKCQDGDWDTEGESLERFLHVPWVVRAFAARGVTATDEGEKPTRRQVSTVVRSTIDSLVSADFYDLSEDYERRTLTSNITDAIAALFSLDDA